MRRDSHVSSRGPPSKEIPVRMPPPRKESEITLGTTLEQVAADAESANTETEEYDDYHPRYYHSDPVTPTPYHPQNHHPTAGNAISHHPYHQPTPQHHNHYFPRINTFMYQDTLPRLPIPSLDETLNKFLRHVEALYDTKVQQLQAQQHVLDFLKSDGPKLQDLLLDYEQAGLATGVIGSYVEEFWNETNLVPDPNVVLNLNPFFVLEDGPDPKTNKDPLRRAASLCFACIKMASQLRNEAVLPDSFKGRPLCMDQFKAVFGAARVPQPPDDAYEGGADDIDIYPDSGHVVVMCRKQLYYFQCLWWDGSVAVDEEDVIDILEAIQKNATQSTSPAAAAASSLGVLTTLDRKTWGKVRAELSEVAMNNEYLIIMDSSLFVLVLDDYIPTNVHDAAANMLHGSYQIRSSSASSPLPDSAGVNTNASVETDRTNKHNKNRSRNVSIHTSKTEDTEDDDFTVNPVTTGSNPTILHQLGTCCNRWYDKLQIIVCGDGTAGINFEHSAIDGHTALRVASDIYAETVVNFAQSITKTIHAHQQHLNHHLPPSSAPSNSHGLPSPGGGFTNAIPHVIHAKVQRAATTMDEHGRPALDVMPKKMQFTIPPSVKRQIFHAETALGDKIVASETIVLEFNSYGKSMITSNNFSPDAYVQMSILLAYYKIYGKVVCAYEPVLTKTFFHGRTEAMRSATREAKELCERFFQSKYTPVQKLSLLRRAIQTQVQYVAESARGKGVDRHLFALKCIAERHDLSVPEFFVSEPWKKLNHSILSTSNCGNPSIRLFGFGPVVPDGYGIGYIIKDSSISFTISSKHRQTRRYAFGLEGVLKAMAKLLKRHGAQGPDDQQGTRRVSLKKMPAIHSMGQDQQRIQRQRLQQEQEQHGQHRMPDQIPETDALGPNGDTARRRSKVTEADGVRDFWGESDYSTPSPDRRPPPAPTAAQQGRNQQRPPLPQRAPSDQNKKKGRWMDSPPNSKGGADPDPRVVPPQRGVSASSLSAMSTSTNGSGNDIASGTPDVVVNIDGHDPIEDSPTSRNSDTRPQHPDRRASHFAGQRRRETTSLRDLYEMSGITLDFEDDDVEDDEEEDVTSTSVDPDNTSLHNYKHGESAIMGECSIATFEEI